MKYKEHKDHQFIYVLGCPSNPLGVMNRLMACGGVVGEDFKNLVEDFYNLKNKLNIAGLHLNILTANPRLTSCNLKKLPFN